MRTDGSSNGVNNNQQPHDIIKRPGIVDLKIVFFSSLGY